MGPLARWKQAALPDLAKRLRWALAAVGLGLAGIRRIGVNWIQAAKATLGVLLLTAGTGAVMHFAMQWLSGKYPDTFDKYENDFTPRDASRYPPGFLEELFAEVMRAAFGLKWIATLAARGIEPPYFSTLA